jgi:phosphate/sulfate permease
MNTNAISHQDLIFSVTADWVLLPILAIGFIVFMIFLYKLLKAKKPN